MRGKNRLNTISGLPRMLNITQNLTALGLGVVTILAVFVFVRWAFNQLNFQTDTAQERLTMLAVILALIALFLTR